MSFISMCIEFSKKTYVPTYLARQLYLVQCRPINLRSNLEYGIGQQSLNRPHHKINANSVPIHLLVHKISDTQESVTLTLTPTLTGFASKQLAPSPSVYV